MTPHMERYTAGLWLAKTKAFPAKFPGRCAQCARPILEGEMQVGVFSKDVDRAWMHDDCTYRAGIPAFVGKA